MLKKAATDVNETDPSGNTTATSDHLVALSCIYALLWSEPGLWYRLSTSQDAMTQQPSMLWMTWCFCNDFFFML